MQETSAQTNKMTTAALCLGIGLMVAAGTYLGWREFIQDKIIKCEFDLGDVHFDAPDIGQRLYCPDNAAHRGSGS